MNDIKLKNKTLKSFTLKQDTKDYSDDKIYYELMQISVNFAEIDKICSDEYFINPQFKGFMKDYFFLLCERSKNRKDCERLAKKYKDKINQQVLEHFSICFEKNKEIVFRIFNPTLVQITGHFTANKYTIINYFGLNNQTMIILFNEMNLAYFRYWFYLSYLCLDKAYKNSFNQLLLIIINPFSYNESEIDTELFEKLENFN
ncbi:MAG: hypothetical protein HUJ42_01395 [Malacoplasma sp.]|nr:hypothetical protein [Malacoplasma sp.]